MNANNFLVRDLKIIIMDDDQYFVDAIKALLIDMLKIYGVSAVSLTFNYSIQKNESADWIIMGQSRSIYLPQLSFLKKIELKSFLSTIIYDNDDSYDISPAVKLKAYSLCRNHSLLKNRMVLYYCFRMLCSSKFSMEYMPCQFAPRLTKREMTVIFLISKGIGIQQMANILMTSPKTISAFVVSIKVKLGMQNSQSLYKWLSSSKQEVGTHLIEVSFK